MVEKVSSVVIQNLMHILPSTIAAKFSVLLPVTEWRGRMSE